MDEVIVYFKCRKDNLKGDGNQYPLTEKRERYDLLFWLVTLPFSEQEMKKKKPEAVKKKLRGIYKRLQKEMKKKEVCCQDVWYEMALQEHLQYEHPVFPLSFVTGIFRSCQAVEQLLLRDGEEALPFAAQVYGHLNALAVYTGEEEKWEEFIEEAYGQTGLLVTCNCFFGRKEGSRTCLIDFAEMEFSAYRIIPQEALYIDFAPTRQKKRIILAKCKDITYCTYAKFLDSDAVSKV